MARAKSTDRAEARRRYRQTVAAEEAAFDEGLDAAVAADDIPAAARAHRQPVRNAPPTPAAVRPSLLSALRGALAPADIGGDLRALPQIVLRTKAFALPAALSVLAGAGFLVTAPSSNIVAVLAFQAFVVPPPMAASFLGGLFAPRAAWAVGGLVGMAAAIVFAVVAVVYPETSSSVAPGTVASTLAQRQDAIVFALVASPTMGVAVGAFAGFYRRFLRSASTNQPRSNRQKRAATRR